MSTAQYMLVLIVALVAGFIGRIGSSQLAGRGLLPAIFLPAHTQIRKGFFEVVDNEGNRRVRLEKQRLTFFDHHWEPYEVLNPSTLRLYDPSTHRSIEVSFEPPIVRGGQSIARHGRIRIPDPPVDSGPQLGVYVKDGEIIWKVPEDRTWTK